MPQNHHFRSTKASIALEDQLIYNALVHDARIGLLTLLTVAIPLLTFGAPAPATPAAPASPAGKIACKTPAPRPLLKKAGYREYAFDLGPENTAAEQASTGTVRIGIQTAGCYDGYEHSFIFDESNPLASFDDRDHWLLFASEQLKALQTFRRGQVDVKELVSFLDRAKTVTTRKSDSELRLEVCRDGSQPPSEDGCPLASGGGYRFAARQLAANRVQVFVSRYLAL